MRATLTYHSIDSSGSPISVPPEVFEGHARWLTDGAVQALGLDDLLSRPGADDDAVAVTFDDGLNTAYDGALRLLDAGVPVTIFAVCGRVGRDNAWSGRHLRGVPRLPLMDWPALERLASSGASIAVHTRSHPSLTTLRRAQLEDELGGAARDLEERLGIRSAHVAYPYGDVDAVVAAEASRRFRWGHTTECAVLSPDDDPLRLPRLDMYYFRRPGALEAWGTSGFMRRLAWVRARRRARAILAGG